MFMFTLLICFTPQIRLIPLLQEKRLCAHPFLEIYRDGQIHFMAPLARQDDFYVPEVRRVERRPLAKEELLTDSDVSGIIFIVAKHGEIDFVDTKQCRKQLLLPWVEF